MESDQIDSRRNVQQLGSPNSFNQPSTKEALPVVQEIDRFPK